MIIEYVVRAYKDDIHQYEFFSLPKEAKTFADFYRQQGFCVMVFKRMLEPIDL